jgi:antitoxin component of MazEF toxin-antitoxin module
MQKRTRKVDARGRTTLFADFAGCTVTVERIGPEEVRIRKVPLRRKYTLAQLVAGITKENRHPEIPTMPSAGEEFW